MFNIVDLIVVIIIGLTTFIGYKRGFVKTAFGMASFIVALVLAITLYKPVAVVLADRTGIDEWIHETILGKVDEINEEKQIETTENSENESIKETFENLPEKIKNELGLEEAKTKAKDAIAVKASEIALKLISFVGIYVIARIVLAVACFVLDLVMKAPVLKQANEVLGLIIGLLQGIMSVFVVLAIIMSLSSIVNLDWLLTYVKSSLITSIMYENNFVMWLLF